MSGAKNAIMRSAWRIGLITILLTSHGSAVATSMMVAITIKGKNLCETIAIPSRSLYVSISAIAEKQKMVITWIGFFFNLVARMSAPAGAKRKIIPNLARMRLMNSRWFPSLTMLLNS